MGTPPIALDIRPPQPVAGPLDLYQQRMSVQTLINQDKLQKQAMQQNETEQQQQQLKLQQDQEMEADKQKFNQVFHDAGGDWDAAISGASKSGVSAQFISNAQKMRTDQISKLATATKDQLENHGKQNEEIGLSAQKVLGAADEGASPEDLQALYSQERNAHILSGGFKPQDIPEKMPPIDQLRTIAASSKAARDMVTAAQDLQDKKAKAATESIKGGQDQLGLIGQTLGSAKSQLEWDARKDFLKAKGVDSDLLSQVDSIYSPEAAERAKSLGVSPEKQAELIAHAPDEKGYISDYMAGGNPSGKPLPDTPQNRQAARRSYAAMKPTIVANIGAGAAPPAAPPEVHGADYLKLLKPTEAAAIKFYGDGNGDMATYMSRMKPMEKQNFIAKVTAYNPDAKQSLYGVGKSLDTSFTSGTYSQQLNAINTARNHMKTFVSLADALDNGNTQLLNKAKQAWNQEFGSDAPTNFLLARDAFAGEVGKSLAGANVTQGDRNKVEEAINRAESPSQLRGAAKTADELLEGKQHALKQTYEAGKKGNPNFGEEKPAQSSGKPSGATHTGIGSVDKKKHWLDANNNDLGVAE